MLTVALALSLQSGFFRTDAKLPDVFNPSSPAQVSIGGYIGQRIKNNEQNRLVEVDLKPLLEGFHHQPGSHPWIGEHVGKWVHASTLAWANTKDPKLKTKLDAAVKELISCQQADGYLGTYTPDKRFGLYEGADWDVWTHKYDLLGLLTYYRFTDDEASLTCCKRIGDLLINTFGPNKKSILSAGTHMGMAATSVLEPIVLLYRCTGEQKYLDFAKYIVASWEEKGGPKIISTLAAGKPIDQVGNGKAYEMLSNLVGLCELARATGDKIYLETAKRAWADVVKHELYITGTASYFEHFHPGEDLPNETSKNVGETCVTVTWMQLCQQLFRLTGEAKYAAEFERSEYNHLAAAQRPDGREWCYYTSLQGAKPYTHETCCCLSSGPRGMAIIPETAYLTEQVGESNYLVVNTVETSNFVTDLKRNWRPKLLMASSFPHEGKAELKVDATKIILRMAGYYPGAAEFGLKIRIPTWTSKFTCSMPGRIENGYYVIPPRIWRKETLKINFPFKALPIKGTGKNAGLVSWRSGPFVLAEVKPRNDAQVAEWRKDKLPFVTEYLEGAKNRSPRTIYRRPFAEVGASYRVWGSLDGGDSLFQDAIESRSAKGNVEGSICDGDEGTFVVTYDGTLQREASFTLQRESPVKASRFVYCHGQTFHDGGWFINPRIEVQEIKGGPWVSLGALPGYPKTTMTDAAGLQRGQKFVLKLPKPISIVGIRVVGTPASGDNPKLSFASCGELQALP